MLNRVELPIAMELHKNNTARVVPVVVRRCGWQRYFGEIQILPRGGRPLREWADRDKACFDVEEGLRSTVKEQPPGAHEESGAHAARSRGVIV